MAKIHENIEKIGLRNKDKANFPYFKFDKPDNIRFIASEAYTFSRFYLLLLKQVPDDDKVFELVKLLIAIIRIIVLFEFDNDLLILLHNLIRLFLLSCSEMKELKMTAKFHHMIHYPRMIEMFGPLKILSTLNFESFHSSLKTKISTSNNWKNVVLTVLNKCARAQLVDYPKIPIEQGKHPVFFVPADLAPIVPSMQFTGLDVFNKMYRVNTSAVIYEALHDCLSILRITAIYLEGSEYYVYGELFYGHEDEKNRVVLDRTGSLGVVKITPQKIPHEIYKEQDFSFIVPYHHL